MLILSFLLMAGQAQPPGERQPTQEIVVTAPDRSVPTKQQVRETTRAVSQTTDGQMARYAERICPQARDFPLDYGAVVERRIRREAATLGVAVAAAGCSPNLIVMAVEDGRALLRALTAKAPTALGGIPPERRKRLLAEPGPVHVINLTELRGSQGERYGSSSDLVNSNLAGFPSMIVHEISIINLSTRQDLTGSLVLIDRSALEGRSLAQIADYAMMRALARTDPSRDRGAVDSILALFDGNNAPPGLTGFDRAYLAGLYHGPGNRPANAVVGTISADAGKQLRSEAAKR